MIICHFSQVDSCHMRSDQIDNILVVKTDYTQKYVTTKTHTTGNKYMYYNWKLDDKMFKTQKRVFIYL